MFPCFDNQSRKTFKGEKLSELLWKTSSFNRICFLKYEETEVQHKFQNISDENKIFFPEI